MNLFSISQLSQFSGIKPHTIRVWEQRYNALSPYRSEGNTRYYDNKQLRRLLNIVSLMDTGIKVSQLCSLTDEEMFSRIYSLTETGNDDSTDYYVNQLISAGISFNSTDFDHTFLTCLSKYGLRETYKKVIYPVMDRIGLLWASDVLPAASEHFISNLFRQKLYAVIDSLESPGSLSETWLLFLPENEFHELALLYAHLLIRLTGQKVIYLGSNVPFESLKIAIKETNPTKLLMFLIHYDTVDQIQKNLEYLNACYTEKTIYLAGNQKLISGLKYPKNIKCLHSVEDLEKLLDLDKYVKPYPETVHNEGIS